MPRLSWICSIFSPAQCSSGVYGGIAIWVVEKLIFSTMTNGIRKNTSSQTYGTAVTKRPAPDPEALEQALHFVTTTGLSGCQLK